MTKTIARSALAASVSLLALSAAQAGGLTNTSQSAVFNGMGYAGFAAPGSESAATMFMNPATMTEFKSFTLDTNYTFGIPNTTITHNATGARSGDVGMDYFVPATYIIYPVNERITFGLSLNTTYGNTIKPENPWLGSALGHTSKLRVITATPSIAYKINEAWSVGFGIQAQYASARQTAFPPPPAGPMAGILHAAGWSAGFTAGVTWKPVQGTQIGLGFRSLTEQDLAGRVMLGGVPYSKANGTINLPNRVNLSIRQAITRQFDLLGSVEWQNYGRIGDAALKNLPPPLAPLARLPFGYKDAWMFSLGGEYKYNPALTLRAGLAYEISPVTDAVRRVTLPDNDRTWLSAGFSYKVSDRFALNASYSYLFIKKAPIVQSGLAFTAKGHAQLLSVGLTSKWGAPPAREDAVVRKY